MAAASLFIVFTTEMTATNQALRVALDGFNTKAMQCPLLEMTRPARVHAADSRDSRRNDADTVSSLSQYWAVAGRRSGDQPRPMLLANATPLIHLSSHGIGQKHAN